MPTDRFSGLILGTNLAGTDNADGTLTIDATGGGGGLTEIEYAEFTSAVNVTGGSEAAATTIVTAAAITADGSTPIFVEFFCPLVRNSAVSAVTFYLFEDGTSTGSWVVCDVNTANTGYGVAGLKRFVPSAGSRTYSVRAARGSGTCTAYAGTGGAGVAVPGFIRISEVA